MDGGSGFAAPRKPRLRSELADFWRFMRHPHPLRRLPGRTAAIGWVSDWQPGIGPGRLLAWVALLWLINLFALGPVAIAAAAASGVTPRFEPASIPPLIVLVWAPLVEELLFRYGLRRPKQALWLCPALLPVVLCGPRIWTGLLLAVVVLLACRSLQPQPEPLKGWSTVWRRRYLKRFGWVFHLTALAFAAMHLSNFSFNDSPYWLLPLLVLPQWVTGLVLGWIRMRRGIGASITLHAAFNAGPMLLIWSMLRWAPGAVN